MHTVQCRRGHVGWRGGKIEEKAPKARRPKVKKLKTKMKGNDVCDGALINGVFPSKKTVRVRTRTAPLASSTTLKRKSKKRKRMKHENERKKGTEKRRNKSGEKKGKKRWATTKCLVVWLFGCTGFVCVPGLCIRHLTLSRGYPFGTTSSSAWCCGATVKCGEYIN